MLKPVRWMIWPVACLMALTVMGASRAGSVEVVQSAASDFDAEVLFRAPKMLLPRGPQSWKRNDKLVLTLWVTRDKRTHAVRYEAVLQAMYEDQQWRRYDTVSLTTGEQVVPQRLLQEVRGCDRYNFCQYTEAYRMTMNDAQVRAAMTSGLRLRWNAQAADAFEAEVPAEYFTALAEAVKTR